MTGKVLLYTSEAKFVDLCNPTFSPQTNLFYIIPLCDAKHCIASILFSSDSVKSHGCELGAVSPVGGHRWLFITLKAADWATFLEIFTSRK
jgi:hypothetical protein